LQSTDTKLSRMKISPDSLRSSKTTQKIRLVMKPPLNLKLHLRAKAILMRMTAIAKKKRIQPTIQLSSMTILKVQRHKISMSWK